MRRIGYLCALIATTWAASAACAEGPYLAVEGGLYTQQKLDYDFVGLDNFFTTGYRNGFAVSGKVGYDWDGLRFELEGAYNQAKLRRFGFNIDGQQLLVQEGDLVTGNLNTASIMANGYWDILTHGTVRPFIGGGVGVAFVTSDRVGYSGFGADGIFLNQTDTAFAFQLMGGMRVKLTNHLLANVSYRYFDVEKVRLDVFSAIASTSLRTSSVLGGITYAFGSRAPLIPRPPAPPPAVRRGPVPVEAMTPEEAATATGVAAQAAEPVTTSFMLDFAPGSAGLSPSAYVALDGAHAAFDRVGHAALMITSPVEGAGPVIYDEALAQRRAKVVASELVGRGVPLKAIAVQTYDIHGAAIPPDEPTPGKPTVDVTFGAGAGH